MQFRFGRVVSLFTFCASALVAGCGHIPVTTMYKLWSFDFAHADPGAIRAAIRVPDALMARPAGAKLTLTRNTTGSASPVVETFILEEVRDPRELEQLARFARSGYPVTAYKLAAPDVQKLKSMQAEINAARAAGKADARGNLGVAIDACHRKAMPQGALLSSTYLKLDDEAGYMPLVEDIDLRKEISSEDLAKQIPPCGRG